MSLRVHLTPWVMVMAFTYGACEIARDANELGPPLRVASRIIAGGITATGLIKVQKRPTGEKE